MLTDQATTIRGDTFIANCKALSRRQPELADRLRTATLPSAARIVPGRDGLLVAQLTANDHEVSWLGGSSMPSVSAPIAVASFQNRGTSVAVASIGTGYEAIHLARRLPPHCAVFVCEEHTASIALALCAADMRQLIEAGRIVFLDGDVSESLCAFLAHNPGYSGPEQLFSPGETEQSNIARLSAALALGMQQAEKARPAYQPGAAKPAGADKPTFAVLSIDAVGGAVTCAGQIERACDVLDWRVAICVPDAPDRCHRHARTSAVIESGANLLVCLNSAPRALGLPESIALPAACWFLESPALPAYAFAGIETCRLVLAASARVRELLIDRGAAPEAVSVLEAGVDETIFGLDRQQAATPTRDRIVVCCDATDTSAAAAGISLESHERLWNEMQELIAESALCGNTVQIDALMRRAERNAAAKLTDERVRLHLSKIVASRLVKTVSTRTLIQQLTSHAMVDVWGDGWHANEAVHPFCRGSLADAHARRRMFESAAWVVLPYADEAAIQLAREALASGACPLIQRSVTQLLDCYPQTGELLKSMPMFDSADDLVAQVNSRPPQDITSRLGSTLLADHTVRHRLLDLRRRLQSLPD